LAPDVKTEKRHGRLGGRRLDVSIGFIGKKKPEEKVSSKRARAQCCLQTRGSYRRVAEVPARSLERKIPSDSLKIMA
jgi:hypothetical protein